MDKIYFCMLIVGVVVEVWCFVDFMGVYVVIFVSVVGISEQVVVVGKVFSVVMNYFSWVDMVESFSVGDLVWLVIDGSGCVLRGMVGDVCGCVLCGILNGCVLVWFVEVLLLVLGVGNFLMILVVDKINWG